MPSTAQLLLFVPAAVLLLVIPGPSVLFIVTRSIEQGRRAGLVSVFLAFLPQFVEPDRGHVTVQVLVLGLVFVAVGMMSDSCYALAGSGLGAALRRSHRARRAERYLSSGVYVGLGATTAIAGGHRSTS